MASLGRNDAVVQGEGAISVGFAMVEVVAHSENSAKGVGAPAGDEPALVSLGADESIQMLAAEALK